MLFRLTLPLNEKLGRGPLSVRPRDENPFADWTARLILVGRAEFVLLCNTNSFYSVVFSAKQIDSEGRFVHRALNRLRVSLEADGFHSVYEREVAPASARVEFARTSDRSVSSTMNGLTEYAKRCLRYDATSLETSLGLDQHLLSALGTSKSVPYGVPRQAFQAMVDASST